MTILLAIWGYRRLIGIALLVAGLAGAGLYVRHLQLTVSRQAATITATQRALDSAVETNAQNIEAFARFKVETERAQAAVAADSQRAQDTAAAVATIHEEISHAAEPTPAPVSKPGSPARAAPVAGGPGLATRLALDRLRELHAAGGGHQAADREGGHSGPAAVVPARP